MILSTTELFISISDIFFSRLSSSQSAVLKKGLRYCSILATSVEINCWMLSIHGQKYSWGALSADRMAVGDKLSSDCQNSSDLCVFAMILEGIRLAGPGTREGGEAGNLKPLFRTSARTGTWVRHAPMRKHLTYNYSLIVLSEPEAAFTIIADICKNRVHPISRDNVSDAAMEGRPSS